eukprot:435396_1
MTFELRKWESWRLVGVDIRTPNSIYKELIRNYRLIFVFVSLYTFIFMTLVELSRRYRKIQVLLYWIMPFILIPILIYYPDPVDPNTLFDYVKMVSVIFASWVCQFDRHKLEKWREKNCKILVCILVWITYIVLVINIFEAVLTDWNKMVNEVKIFPGNAIHGVLLILTLPNATNIKTSTKMLDDNYYSIRWKLGGLWTFAYTVWNAIFVYNEYCYELLLNTIYHLGIPLIILTWTHCDEWIQYRVYALCLYKWINTLPYFKWYLPYFRFFQYHCDLIIPDPVQIKIIINLISFGIGTIILIKDIYHEIKSWNGIPKPRDTSLIQWLVRKCCKIMDKQKKEKKKI